MTGPRTYREAGVDIDAGDRFSRFIASIKSPALLKSIGGFAGGVPLDVQRFRNPVLLSSTDGVGTKLLVARELGIYDTVGIDLVAMCVNDLLVCGAEPLLFLDYIACGAINEPVLQAVVGGIVRGCEMARCVLAGGETAEMPDLYAGDEIDLAGFSVGLVERDRQLPRPADIRPGDRIVGLGSSGVHSNGFSLVRKVLPKRFWHSALTPTIIYEPQMRFLREHDAVTAAAHITGGGLEGNIARVVPEGMVARLTWDWKVPEVFPLIQEHGRIAPEEMRRVFNMGIGLAAIISQDGCDAVLAAAHASGIDLVPIGTVQKAET